MKDKKMGFSLLSVIIIICICSVISAITVGVIVTNGHNTSGLSYQDIANDDALNSFLEVYSDIINNYYEDVDKEELIDKAVDGMLDYLGDAYTTYMTDEEKQALEDSLAGTYQGIGVEIQDQVIVSIIKNSPAEKAGLKANDVIISLNGETVEGKNGSEISALIKACGENEIKIVVKRGEEELTFSLKSGTVISKDVTYELLDNNIGYVGMSIFSKTLDTQVKDALADLESQGMDRLIIDLRGNTGGYLAIAESIASMFLEKGKLIYSLEDKNATTDYYDKTDSHKTYPIVILINGRTASASEVLAAALKDSYGALFVGETSYGKGKVQETSDLSDGSTAKYTSAKWLRPNGECIDGVGLKPDFEVQLTYNYDENGNETSINDTQLERAKQIISAM